MLPAKVMVAPNSPSARAQPVAAPASRPGAASGTSTERKARAGDARRVAAASRYLRSTSVKPARAAPMKNGAATNAWATTTPSVVKGSVMPRAPRAWPASPFRPKAVSSATPATVGGSTIGRSMNASRSALPAKLAHREQVRHGQPERDDDEGGGKTGDEAEPERLEHQRLAQALDQDAPGDRRTSRLTSGRPEQHQQQTGEHRPRRAERERRQGGRAAGRSAATASGVGHRLGGHGAEQAMLLQDLLPFLAPHELHEQAGRFGIPGAT